jgi:flagellar assembly factor FliW
MGNRGMQVLITRDFGPVSYAPEEVFDFPAGLPGFPECRRFLTLRPYPAEAWVVLQSLDRREVAFVTVPAETLVGDYELQIVAADLALLKAGPSGFRRPKGRDYEGLMALVLITLPETGPALANLLGPLVLNPAARRGVQAIREDLRYGAAEPVEELLNRRESVLSAASGPEVLLCS